MVMWCRRMVRMVLYLVLKRVHRARLSVAADWMLLAHPLAVTHAVRYSACLPAWRTSQRNQERERERAPPVCLLPNVLLFHKTPYCTRSIVNTAVIQPSFCDYRYFGPMLDNALLITNTYTYI